MRKIKLSFRYFLRHIHPHFALLVYVIFYTFSILFGTRTGHTLRNSSIIEYEVNVNVKTKPVKVEVELWDLSGDIKYENCWPAVFKGSHGVMFVYSPDHSEHSRELEDWHTRTHRTFPLKDTCCCVVSNNKSAKVDRDIVVLPLAFSKFKHIKNNIADDGEKLREQFGKFITQILSSRQEATEQEELNIMNA